MPDDLRQPCRRRRIAAALGADDAVDDGHADAGQLAEPDAVQHAARLQQHNGQLNRGRKQFGNCSGSLPSVSALRKPNASF
jgi:hypothetical protein